MVKQALELWQGLPIDTRRMLLSNVWCGECRKAVTIVDYHAELNGVVVLQGFCGTCGHKVARVIDDLAPAPKKKAKATASGLYIFDVWLYGNEGCTEEKKILRRIQIPRSKSLYNFARVITDAFGFYFDHCFGFYDNFQRYPDSKMSYELFVDIGEAPLTPRNKGVKKTKIQQAFKSIEEKRLFLFDYGDCWYFEVVLKEIKNAEKHDLKPVILESIGNAPLQYPPCEDDENSVIE
jgi:hypothetical protein